MLAELFGLFFQKNKPIPHNSRVDASIEELCFDSNKSLSCYHIEETVNGESAEKFFEQPPKLELKPLPAHLKYAFLDE